MCVGRASVYASMDMRTCVIHNIMCKSNSNRAANDEEKKKNAECMSSGLWGLKREGANNG